MTIKATDPLNVPGNYVIEAVNAKTNKVLGLGNAVVEPGNMLYAAFDTSNNAVPIKSTVYRGQADIEWMVSPDNQVTWISAGDTNDKAYVTLDNPDGTAANGDAVIDSAGQPDTSAPVAAIPETVLDIGCRSAAGATTSATILADIWPAFAAPAAAPPEVTNVRGKVMTYWGSPFGPTDGNPAAAFTASGLLQFNTGRCGGWSRLLVAVLAAQRITAKFVTITVPPVSLTGWGPSTTNFFVTPSLPAQGTPKPFNYFPDHAVVVLSGAAALLAPFTIFDPSYGKKYAVAGAASFASAEQTWANASVSQVVDTWTSVSIATGLPISQVRINDVTPALVAGPPALFNFKDQANVPI